MAQDDAGAQEAYEREQDEEEEIRRLDAEAVARRAQGAVHTNGGAGPSSSAGPSDSAAGNLSGLEDCLLECPTIYTPACSFSLGAILESS